MIDWICNGLADGILSQCKKGMPKLLAGARVTNRVGYGLSKALGGGRGNAI